MISLQFYYSYTDNKVIGKMDKENNNRSAAGLRRSAIVERIRLREEWSALKGAEASSTKPQTGVLAKRHGNIAKNILNKKNQGNLQPAKDIFKMKDNIKENTRGNHLTCDLLCGVVALVDVGAESRALALRAALSALGASVVPTWSPLVTHLVWAQGGCRATRAKARALACRLVSPLWVEACAGAARRLPEHAFPAAARPSDLPSPKTLRRLLIQAEMENVSLAELLDDSKEDKHKPMRLRISSETERDTSTDKATDTSRDTSHDTSAEKSRETTTDMESRVNTAPRRALPLSLSVSPKRATKSRRKLFTYKEGEVAGRTSDESDADRCQTRPASKLPQRARRDLARAERMARKLVAACERSTAHSQNNLVPQPALKPRIVLTGMGRVERQRITEAIQSLGGRIQSHVNKRTTHVLLGSCQEEPEPTGNNGPRGLCSNITGIANHSLDELVVHRSDVVKARTVNALAGGARGARVLLARWALACAAAGKWLHHHGYEVQHLKKISQKARIERKALGRLRSEYAYDIFNGMRVRISPNADQKDAATQLLNLCGAVTQNGGLTRNGGLTQNGGERSADFDMTIGTGEGEISSKWVFDSVAAGRMRTTRRYKNTSIPDSGNLFASLRTDR